jgi:uncharacterized membrane protein YeiH
MRYVIDLLGVAVFAISGVLAAGRKGLDLLGVGVVAIVTAIGGGTLRDLLLDRHPIFWIADPTYLWVIAGATALTLAYVRFWLASRRALLIADAFGLAFFTISGVQITLMTGHPALIALAMGTITGVAGGVLRDILTREIPLILRPGRLYATAAIAGAIVYLLLAQTAMPPEAAALAAMGVMASLRLVAIAYGLTLPAVDVSDEVPR